MISDEYDTQKYVLLITLIVVAKLRSVADNVYNEFNLKNRKFKSMAIDEICNDLIEYDSLPVDDDLKELMGDVMLRIMEND